MTVGVQRKARGVVAEQTGERFHVHAVYSASVAKVWRRSWKRTCSSPARFKTRCSIFSTLSGEIGPPEGEENTYSLNPFSLAFFSFNRKKAAFQGKLRIADD